MQEKLLNNNRLHWALEGKNHCSPPVWLMRQAGRYLPEFRELRARAGSFLDLCYNPELACQATLQPIRRFDFDAAIIFADILLVPHALGQDLRFVPNKGPELAALDLSAEFDGLKPQNFLARLSPVFETVSRVRDRLATDKSVIGFCGAPWTVATYMVTGQSSGDHFYAKSMALRYPDRFSNLIDILVECSVEYLSNQIRAGADVVQIFDSWAGVLDDEMLRQWSIEPIAKMVEELKKRHPQTPIIAFPKNIGLRFERFCRQTKIDGIGIDWTCPLEYARDKIQPDFCIQGNIDPVRLAIGGAALEQALDQVLSTLDTKGLIVNLGHGITPQTPIKNVSDLVAMVRKKSYL